MSANGTKKLTESKTFWGVFLAWLTSFLQGHGIQVEDLTSGTVTTSVMVALFSAVALWGRYKANTKIDKLV